MKYFVCTIIILFFINANVYAQKNTIHLTKSKVTPVIDGVLEKNEWKNAKELTIHRTTGQKITVLVKYDAENLFVAFKNLTEANKAKLNPEILIDTGVTNLNWNENCYWFHASYSNCSSIGTYYNWGDCSKTPIGWKANTFPFIKENNNIEFKISFSKLHMTPTKEQQLKIAFKLSDLLDQHSYWPETAAIDHPLTWGILKF